MPSRWIKTGEVLLNYPGSTNLMARLSRLPCLVKQLTDLPRSTLAAVCLAVACGGCFACDLSQSRIWSHRVLGPIEDILPEDTRREIQNTSRDGNIVAASVEAAVYRQVPTDAGEDGHPRPEEDLVVPDIGGQCVQRKDHILETSMAPMTALKTGTDEDIPTKDELGDPEGMLTTGPSIPAREEQNRSVLPERGEDMPGLPKLFVTTPVQLLDPKPGTDGVICRSHRHLDYIAMPHLLICLWQYRAEKQDHRIMMTCPKMSCSPSFLQRNVPWTHFSGTWMLEGRAVRMCRLDCSAREMVFC